jgi:hypothetical protein
MSFEVPKLIYRPTKFYKMKNKDRRIYEHVCLLYEAVLRHHKFNFLDDEKRYKFDKWMKDQLVESLLKGDFKGMPVATHRAKIDELIKRLDVDIASYEEIYKSFTQSLLIS